MNEHLPLVSVVTITRNRGPLLKRCISSVLSQTYSNIEYVIVDGASTDNTDVVVSEFHDARLTYIKLDTNWPIAKTINYAVSLTKGDYLTFLDSDDEYLPCKIQKQLDLMLTLPEDYGMVYCWMSYYESQSHQLLHVHNPSLKGYVPDEVIENPVVSGTPTYFFMRSAFFENGGWKDKDEIGIVSDWELAARFCQKWKVDYVPESLINVYVNHHCGLRMSDSQYYRNFYENDCRFHKYFLEYFSANFKRCPGKKATHLLALSKDYFRLNHFAKALYYLFQFLLTKILHK